MNIDFLSYNGNAIYCIQNVVNGKIYIGQTKEYRTRMKFHLRSFKKGTHCNPYLQRVFNRDSGLLSISIIETPDKSLLNKREVFWINFFNSTNPKKGYNLSPGGNVIFHQHTEERRENSSRKMKQMWKDGTLSTVRHTDETKNKMSKSRREFYKDKPKSGAKIRVRNLQGDELGICDSIKQMAKQFNIHPRTVYLTLKSNDNAVFPLKGFKIERI